MKYCLFASICVIGIGSAAAVDDVLDRSDIARERVLRLHLAHSLYWNHHGHPPAEPRELFPDWVQDPLDFWHPGDSDPAPITIDNSIPNAPNSDRISYDWHWGDNVASDEPMIFDNTNENNGGRFITMLTQDRVFETEPPLATPTPTRTALAQAHLQANRQGDARVSQRQFGILPG